MKPRVLFLDFDGVCNSHQFITNYLNHFNQPTDKTYIISEHIDPVCVERVNRIVDALDADVVISSAWRKAFSLEELESFLRGKGFTGNIIGHTSIRTTPQFRGNEIQDWMNEHGVTKNNIIILDDMGASEMLHLSDRLIQTSLYTGLMDRHVEAALRLFNPSG